MVFKWQHPRLSSISQLSRAITAQPAKLVNRVDSNSSSGSSSTKSKIPYSWPAPAFSGVQPANVTYSSERLKHLYCRAMQLEVNFFSAQPSSPAPSQLGLLVVDFDDTCSEKDTISVLLSSIVEANAQTAALGCASGNDAAVAESMRQELSARIKQLSAAYISKQQALIENLLPAAPSSNAAADNAVQFDERGLLSFCHALSDFDVDMNQVVMDAGVLKGITSDQVIAAGNAIQLQEGCAHTLAAAAAAGIPVAVLSLNWSSTLIKSTLGLAAPHTSPAQSQQLNTATSPDYHHHHQQQQQQQPQQVEVIANELQWAADGVSTGQLQAKVQSGRDKLQELRDLMAKHTNAAAGAVVYVGDSCSDILAMLEADYGIVVGKNKLLRRVLAAYGVPLRPLCTAPLSTSNSNGGSSNSTGGSSSSSSSSPHGSPNGTSAAPVLYEAGSWLEIAAFLFGPGGDVRRNAPLDQIDSSDNFANSSNSRGFSTLVQVSAARPGAAHGNGNSKNSAGQTPEASLAFEQLQALTAAGAAGPAPPTVLTIAGSDSGGGAGIQADLKTIMANGAMGMSVITALTAQNSRGVQAVDLTPQDFLEQQLDSVLSDLPPAAIKTGMLPSASAVETVAAKLKQYYHSSSGSSGSPQPPLVIDPVLISTSGHALASGGVGAAIKEHLAPLATMLTPNITEAEALWGCERTISSLVDMEAAAHHLHSWGCQTVLIKGGHLPERFLQQQQQQQQHGDLQGQQAIDVLYDGHTYYYFSAPLISTKNQHGTGCTLGAAIATALAAGCSPVQAVAAAKGYLTATLAASASLRLGNGPQHPFHHAAGFSSASGLLNPVQLRSALIEGLSRHAVNPIDLRVYVVTDAGCNAKAGRTLQEAVAAAVAGGATVVQLREKDIDGGDFLKEARAIVEYCRPKGVTVIINDRVDVALAAGADGVHVGQSDLPARAVRQLLGPNKILGVSCKTPEEAAKAQADGADYIGVGAVFPTSTKSSAVIGLAGLQTVCATSGIPVVAIGGVGHSNAEQVLAAGAAGLAVVSAVFAAPDVEAATQQLAEAVHHAQQQQQQQHDEHTPAAVA